MWESARAAVGVAAATILLVLISVGPVSAQETSPARAQMDQMMDQMHGEGASQRMRNAMGPDADMLMDQCAAMMSQMSQMMNGGPGMMGGGAGMDGMMPSMMGR